MRRLIVNGDDFGYARSVNTGIVRAFRDGILTSATLMANGDAFEDAVRIARANPQLGVGCHLVLVGERAVAPAGSIPTLVDRGGRLPRSPAQLAGKLALGQVRQADIETELRAQIARVCAAGIRPTHVDTHKHTHLHPRVMRAVIRVATEFGIKAVRQPYESRRMAMAAGDDSGSVPLARSIAAMAARLSRRRFHALFSRGGLRAPDHFLGFRWTGALTAARLIGAIEHLPEGTTELMCHPGVHDDELESKATRLKMERQRELEALTAPEVKESVRRTGVHLIDFRALAETHA